MATKRAGRRREQHPQGAALETATGSSSGVSAGPPRVARASIPPWLRWVLLAAAIVYLLSLLLNATAKTVPNAILPPSFLFFTQTTCLFPTASRMAIDYRLEGWECGAKRFREIDVAPHFPMHAQDKENRFYRVGHFYRQHRQVMRALERYVIERENKLPSTERTAISTGGIRVSSLRIPFPEVGHPTQRWERRPFETYPETQVKHWYYTPMSRREAFCTGKDPGDDSIPPVTGEGLAAPGAKKQIPGSKPTPSRSPIPRARQNPQQAPEEEEAP